MTNGFLDTLFQPQLFLPLFVGLWLAVAALLSRMGGWSGLAKVFGAPGPVEGERFRFASGSMGKDFAPVNYNNCLFVTVNGEGLRLSVLFLMRFRSPPLFIPWSSVESVNESKVFLSTVHEITIRGHWPKITLRGAAGQAAHAAYSTYR